MATTVQSVRIAADAVNARHARAIDALIEGEVRFGDHDRMLYATDASIYQVEPIGVIIPRTIQDVEATVRYCAKHRLPILPRGGGTSLAGQCVNHAVVLDMSAHLNALGWLDAERMLCHVQPGITIGDLNDELRAHGLFFAPDPSTARQANIGGCIGNNAAGTRSIKYGRTSESIEALDVLLVSGERATLARGSALSAGEGLDVPSRSRARLDQEAATVASLAEGVIEIVRAHAEVIRERFPKTLRRNAGYGLDMILAQLDEAESTGADPLDVIDLAPLVCGAEGTLAVVTGATLKLRPIPVATGLAVIGFDSLDDAVGLVPTLLGLEPAAVELLDDLVIEMARRNLEHAPSVDLMPKPAGGELAAVLYVEFFADQDPDEIDNSFHQLRNCVAMNVPGATVNTYKDAGAMARALELRKAGEPLLHAIPGARKPLSFVEDAAIPVENLGEFVRRFRSFIESKGTKASFWAHASVGVLHVRPLLSLRSPDDLKLMEEISLENARLARELGGVMSGEHGDGRARGPLLEGFYGPEIMDAFRGVKALFDPENLLNPGNIVEPGPIGSIHQRTRVRPEDRDVSVAGVETYFDYSAEDGFGHAVELCNGAGVCRKKHGGTMCPSYMATLDERHSTRGRGNALRLAITGQFGNGESRPRWNDPETMATLDLCLSCKACKSECPTNVDIARYKAEYAAQSFRERGGVPFQARAFSAVRTINALGSAFAPMSNLVATFGPVRALNDAILGLHPDRSLPAFRASLARRLRGATRLDDGTRFRPNEGIGAEAPVVLLFGDCFTMYNEPGIGVATVHALNAFGYRVELANAGCCGRPHLSTGNLEGARDVIASTNASLSDAVERTGAGAVLVAEPSCLSAIRDDWLLLKHRDATDRRALADVCYLPEQFLGERWEEHPRRPPSAAPDGEIVLHAHCHQKALWGAGSSSGLLERLAGADRVRTLGSGCCGMAGSFGYTRGRYDLSMRIGELGVLPAARGLGDEDVLAATGTSCRHQVHDGAGVRSLHPIEIVSGLIRRAGDPES